MRNSFPSKYAPKGSIAPITGALDSVRLSEEHLDLIERIAIGLFLDMQNQPLAKILMACYLTGMQHGVAATLQTEQKP